MNGDSIKDRVETIERELLPKEFRNLRPMGPGKIIGISFFGFCLGAATLGVALWCLSLV